MRLMTTMLSALLLVGAGSTLAGAQELLKNPGFEEVHDGNVAGWDNTPVAVSASGEKTVTGTRSIKLFSDSPEFAPVATQNITGFKQNQKYRLKYQAISQSENSEYRVYVGFWNGKEWAGGAGTDWRKSKTDWEKINVDFSVTKPADRLMVVIQLKGPATMWFDELSLAPAPEEKAAPPKEQLLQNASFEDGLKAWNASPAGVVLATDVATDGKNSIKLSGDDPEANIIATQTIRDFQLNHKYRLSYQARGSRFAQDYRVYVGVWQGDQWVTGIDTNWRQGQEAWQQVAVDFTVTQPSDRLVVVLQAKAPGTVWFDNLSLASAPAEVLPPAIAQFQGSPQFVQIKPDLTLRVRNKPFFPIKIWGWKTETEEAMAKAHEFGFNTIATNHMDSIGPTAMRYLLDAAQKHELMVIPAARVEYPTAEVAAFLPGKLARLENVIGKIKDHPALLAYGLSDEPAWGGFDLNAFAAGAQMIRRLDPNHPIYVNHAPRNTIEELRRYNRYLDISGSDIYPVWKTGLDRHSDLPNKTISVVGDEVIKNLTAVDNAKPILQTLQAFSWSDNRPASGLKDEPFPTHEQLRFMSYYSVVCGATGISFFQDHRYPVLRPELKPVVREFYALQDVLAGGELLASEKVTSAPQVKVLARQWNGHRVLLAVNHTNAEVTAELNWSTLRSTLPGAGSTRLKAVFENRTLALNGGKFTDGFKPYDVHIYTDAPDEARVLRAFKPLQVASQTTEEANGVRAALRAKFDALVPREGRVNLAKDAKTSCSTELSTMPATLVNDGERWGGQWNDSTHNEYPDWVALEFPKEVEIRQIAIYSSDVQVFGQSSSDGIRDYLVQVENEGQWKTIRDVKNHDSVVSVINLEQPVTARKLRIWVTATAGGGDYTRIREIEVY